MVCSGIWEVPEWIIDEDNPQYIQWKMGYDAAYDKHRKKADKNEKEMKAKYKGDTEEEMFISYLKKEYGFKEVKSTGITA